MKPIINREDVLYARLGILWDNLVYTVRSLIQNIRRLIAWIPIIWNDRDWDYIFIYKIIVFKLKQMERHHRNAQIISDYKKIAQQMKMARICLERIIENDCVFDYSEKMIQDDLATFCTIFQKFSKGWWD